MGKIYLSLYPEMGFRVEKALLYTVQRGVPVTRGPPSPLAKIVLRDDDSTQNQVETEAKTRDGARKTGQLIGWHWLARMTL